MYLSPEVQEFANALILLAGVLGAVTGIYAYFKNAMRAVAEPFEKTKKDIDALKEVDNELKSAIDEINNKLDNDDKALKNQETMNEIMMKSLSALLSHSIDGNNIDEMEECRKDIQDHLLGAGSSIR